MSWSLIRPRTPVRAERKVTFVKAHLRVGDAWVEIGIGNVSLTGLMAKTPSVPAEGSEVEIRRRGLEIRGRVVWTAGSRFGLRSHDPIDVDAMLAKSEVGERPVASGAGRSRPPRCWQWQLPR